MTTINSNKAATRREATSRGAAARGAKRTESLWATYRRSRSERARNSLVERYRGYVEGMAAALAARLPRSVDVQDLAHAGVWGLMQAIESFEPDRGIQFVSFMRIRVRGAMLDELRNMDYLPRLWRIRRRALDAAEERLRGALQREPSDAELADELGVTEAILRERFSRPLAKPVEATPRPLDGEPETDSNPLDGLIDDTCESPIEAVNRRELLEKIRASLQPVEWKVLELHYLRGMSGKDVARRLRLSASRVCQIHGRVLTKLKARLRAHA